MVFFAVAFLAAGFLAAVAGFLGAGAGFLAAVAGFLAAVAGFFLGAGFLAAVFFTAVAFLAGDFFAAFFVFPLTSAWNMALTGLGPGPGVALVARLVLAPARAAVLRKQRTSSVAFAGGALRGSLSSLMAQAIVLAR